MCLGIGVLMNVYDEVAAFGGMASTYLLLNASKPSSQCLNLLKSIFLCVQKLMRSAVFEFYERVQLKAITNRLASNLVS